MTLVLFLRTAQALQVNVGIVNKAIPSCTGLDELAILDSG
jgi:hypothetical protein